MALALLGGAARAVGGQMAKSGGKAMAKKVMGRGNKKQNKPVSRGSAQQSGGKSGALTVRPKTTLIPASTMKSSGSKTPDVAGVSGGNILQSIYNSVVQIDKILKGTLAEEKALNKEKTKQDKREERDKREGKLEKKKTKEEKKQKGLSLPKLSFFDRIKQFITSIILGIVLKKLVGNKDFLNNLKSVFDAIVKGVDVTADIILGVIDAAGTFLLWGQKAYDNTLDFINKFGGEDAVKNFEGFISKLTDFFNITLIIGLAAAAIGNELDLFNKNKKKNKTKTRRRNRRSSSKAARKRFARRYGADAARTRFKGKTRPNFFQRIGQSISNKYKAVQSSVTNGVKDLGNAAKQKIVDGIISPVRKFIDPLTKPVLQIKDKLISRISNIPGVQRFLKQQGLSSIGDVGKIAKKFGAKAIPVVGGVFNLLFAYDRLANGDSFGALIELISAILDFSGAGFIGSLALDAYMFARDMFPDIQKGEETLLDGLGVGGLVGQVDKIGKGLPDLGEVVKRFANKDGEYTGGRNMAQRVFDPLQVFSKDKDKPKSITKNSIAGIGKHLSSKGFAVAEHPDFTKNTSGGEYTPGKGSVSNVHKGAGHYDGRAIDVTDHRGSLEDSKGRYRSTLTSLQDNPAVKMLIHDSWGFQKNGKKSGPGSYGHPTHMHIEVKDNGGKIGKGIFANMGGPEFVLDSDSYASIKMKYPGFLAALNAADGAETLKVLEAYASYEAGGESTVVINQNQLPASATQQKQSSSAPIVIPMDSSNPTESLYAMS
jgi:hypothetical protein